MRSIVRYDDIESTLPENDVALEANNDIESASPAKKRQRTETDPKQGPSRQHFQHWDDPGTDSQNMTYDDEDQVSETDVDVKESRYLTHEEIWDDSALIKAWNSAAEEYEAFHGPDKGWKKQPVTKSPLWYNTPLSQADLKASKTSSRSVSTRNAKPSSSNAKVVTSQHDSRPLVFDTYVPEYDPSLAVNGPVHPHHNGVDDSAYKPGVMAKMVSQDEAFSRAVEASYWSGYWTAVYHCHRNPGDKHTTDDAEDAEGQVTAPQQEDEIIKDADEMLSTQR